MRIPEPRQTLPCRDALQTADSCDCVLIFDPKITEVNGKTHLDIIIYLIMKVGEGREDCVGFFFKELNDSPNQ